MNCNCHIIRRKANLMITAANQKQAFKHIKKSLLKKKENDNTEFEFPYLIVSPSIIRMARNLLEIFLIFEWWPIVPQKNGDIIGLRFIGDKTFKDDFFLLSIIAPYIESGGYIEMVAEDGHVFKLIFEKGECKRIEE